jgi:hypothetical protein
MPNFGAKRLKIIVNPRGLLNYVASPVVFIFIAVIERHNGRILYLTYEPSNGQVDTTLFLVGKGVTYDTGGADIKAGGVMAGMSRDKCGAAALAGFMQVCSVCSSLHGVQKSNQE